MNHKLITLYGLLCCGLAGTAKAQDYVLSSPDGHTRLQIGTQDSLSFRILRDGKVLLPGVRISLDLPSTRLGIHPRVLKVRKNEVDDTIRPVVAIKNRVIPDHYRELRLDFQGPYALDFRVYDHAVAYRFITSFPDSVIIEGENLELRLPPKTLGYFQWVSRWMNSYEHLYDPEPLDSLTPSRTAQLPLLLKSPDGQDILITESDLYDYPGLYFTGNGRGEIRSVFPPRVKRDRVNIPGQNGWDREIVPASSYPYIARTLGKRSFPWRIFALPDGDTGLLNNEIVYKLGEPSRLTSSSWIHPGQVAWDWWNDWNITGVDFRAGVNDSTYEYYIDFAARHHIPYIIMDEGWYKLGDLLTVVPAIHMRRLVHYGASKGVGIILWCVWHTLDQQMARAMNEFQAWGIRGIKVDFMDRDDQARVDFYWRCARQAAAHHLLVDFHGAHKPAGLMRTYPNVLNFEGVPGLEQDKWTNKLATPTMAVTLPFIRMFAGPMDYTPGAMRNAQLRDFAPINSNPMSLGTRCQQLAMYMVFDAPLQMLADNPTTYEKEEPCLDFITSVPTTWDQTLPLQGRVGHYVVTARRKGREWFVGAMTNWSSRDLVLDCSFLPQGSFRAVIFRDGVNADRNAMDYSRVVKVLRSSDRLKIHLAPGGGWAARFSPMLKP